MRKRAICMVLAVAVLLSLGAISGCSTNKPRTSTEEDEVTLWPTADPLEERVPGQNISVEDSSFTASFPAASGDGNIIRVWYGNNTSRPATVILRKEHWYGASEILRFSVPAGQSVWQEYTEHSGNQTYSVLVESNGGDSVIGYLRAVQTFEHYTG